VVSMGILATARRRQYRIRETDLCHHSGRTILGYVVFNEIPDGYTLVSAAVIILASVYIFHRERGHKAAR
jgi:hypothetical protein